MTNTHPGHKEITTECGYCGAEIQYTTDAVAASGAATGTMQCPSCGREVETAGKDPKLDEFGPGVGQSGA